MVVPLHYSSYMNSNALCTLSMSVATCYSLGVKATAGKLSSRNGLNSAMTQPILVCAATHVLYGCVQECVQRHQTAICSKILT